MSVSEAVVEAVFVDLARNRDALLRLLRASRVAQEDEVPAVRMLSGGVSSNIFVVALRSGAVCVKQALPKLKVEKEWWAPVSRVFAEIDWLKAAAAVIPGHVPTVLAADEANNAFIMEYLSANDYDNWKSELLQGRAHPEIGEQIGDLLGRVHAATSRDADMARRFARDSNFFALRLEPYLLETARQHADLARQMIGLVHATQNHPYALVHGDVSPKNILLGKRGPVLLDAECACYGDPAFDLAFLLNHILLKAVRLPAILADCAALFKNIVSSHRRHINWESPQTFDARTAALLPGLMLARVDGKSPVEYLNEAQRAWVRSAARRLITTPSGSLDEVSERLRAAVSDAVAHPA